VIPTGEGPLINQTAKVEQRSCFVFLRNSPVRKNRRKPTREFIDPMLVVSVRVTVPCSARVPISSDLILPLDFSPDLFPTYLALSSVPCFPVPDSSRGGPPLGLGSFLMNFSMGDGDRSLKKDIIFICLKINQF
jgi:hypothetical protein